jgi:hypothetical protein
MTKRKKRRQNDNKSINLNKINNNISTQIMQQNKTHDIWTCIGDMT